MPSWETLVDFVQTIAQDEHGLVVILKWKDGTVSRHQSKVANSKCPKR